MVGDIAWGLQAVLSEQNEKLETRNKELEADVARLQVKLAVVSQSLQDTQVESKRRQSLCERQQEDIKALTADVVLQSMQ